MKHGVIALALTCWLAAGVFAAERVPEGRTALTLEELETIDGGNLLLSVDRDKQMMTVTRVTPGNYDSIQCFTVKVTTAVVQNKEVSTSLAKGTMENPNRLVKSGEDQVLLKQFPAGVATVSPVTTTQKAVTGPVITTNATQNVTKVDSNKAPVGVKPDTGYNIHYVDPAKATNTLGCIGVQSRNGMDRVVEALRVDNTTYSSPAQAVQTVTVSSYTNGTPPSAKAFSAVEVKKP